MRWTLPLSLAIALAAAGHARAQALDHRPSTPEIDRKDLSAAEVKKYFEPYAPAVKSCYLGNARNKEATGTLRLELIIHRDGSVFRFGFVAPGVDKPNLVRLDTCLRKLSKTWHFPVRAGFTSAILPFIYVKSNHPGAGPYESCWSPKGCHQKPKKGTP